MRAPLKISLGYLAVSVVWIGASDRLFAASFPEVFPVISLWKGWAFVVVTAGLLYAVLEREWKRRDIAETKLRALAVYDSLTGLLNRAAFIENLGRAIALADRSDSFAGVVFIDLNGFKDVNDRHGHAIGDKLLAEVAGRLRETVRSSDSVARFGGDEFLVMAINNRNGLKHLAHRVRESIQPIFSVHGHELRVTASVGLAIYPEDGNCAEDLIRAADIAMYRAKKLARAAQ